MDAAALEGIRQVVGVANVKLCIRVELERCLLTCDTADAWAACLSVLSPASGVRADRRKKCGGGSKT